LDRRLDGCARPFDIRGGGIPPRKDACSAAVDIDADVELAL
jgi:hypothetical protein